MKVFIHSTFYRRILMATRKEVAAACFAVAVRVFFIEEGIL